jgi:hypothetical protein
VNRRAAWHEVLLLALALAFACVPARRALASEEPRLTVAMHLVTLAERIAKLHAQLGQGVLADRSRRGLAEALRDFDTTLRSVASRAPTPESRDNYALLALQWQDYREWATRPPTRDHARKLRSRTEEVVWVAGKGVKMLQEQGRARANADAVRAEGAAALAQRVAKLHLWARWDIRDEALARELGESSENLRRALDALRQASAPGAGEEVTAAAMQLRFMEDAAHRLKAGEAPGPPIEFIAKTADHILESMQRLVRICEGAGA